MKRVRERQQNVWEVMTFPKCHWQCLVTLLPNTTSNKINEHVNNTRVRTVMNVYGIMCHRILLNGLLTEPKLPSNTDNSSAIVNV